uniref:Zinc finger protein n=1 Tax=Echinostoma caproni TaxID=27848 RepID=A0A183A7R2_9TREM
LKVKMVVDQQDDLTLNTVVSRRCRLLFKCVPIPLLSYLLAFIETNEFQSKCLEVSKTIFIKSVDYYSVPSVFHSHMAGSTENGVDPKSAGNCSVPSGADETEHVQCPICAKFVLSKTAFIHHMTTDHGEQVIAMCKICQQFFPSGEIQAHAIRCKGSHVCPHCRSTFALPSYLQRHLHRQHSSYPRPICDICGKKFSSSCALSKHQRLHRGEMPHSCKLCGASFAQKWHFQMHLDSHHAYVELYNEPKPYNCAVCGRGFFFAISLQNHRNQHNKTVSKSTFIFFMTYVSEWSCDICGKGFAYPSEYKRNYQCSFCPQRFGRSSLLKAHILRHTNPESFTCRYCLRTYSSRSYLHQHLEKHEAVDAQASSISSFSTVSHQFILLCPFYLRIILTAFIEVRFTQSLIRSQAHVSKHPNPTHLVPVCDTSSISTSPITVTKPLSLLRCFPLAILVCFLYHVGFYEDPSCGRKQTHRIPYP